MKKEVLRLQVLSGIITESEYQLKLSNLASLNENASLPSISPEALIEPLEKEQVKDSWGIIIKGAELIELDWSVEKMLFGERRSEEDRQPLQGIMAIKFPEIFSRKAMERYKGKEIEDYSLPIERERLWFKLIDPIALHYGYERRYSKEEAVYAAIDEGKKYVIAQYMS
jgi:hypothetical protein